MNALTTPLVNVVVSGGLIATGLATVGVGFGSTLVVCGATGLAGCFGFAAFAGLPTAVGGGALVYTGVRYTIEVTVPSVRDLFGP